MKYLILPAVLGFTLSFAACRTTPTMQKSSATAHFYLGTYSTKLGHVDGRGEGITRWSLDLETGAMTKQGGPWPVVNASHLCTSPDGAYLYSISEISEYQGRPEGYLTSFAIDSKDHSLRELDTIGAAGAGPAYVHLDRSGRFLLLANYVGGNIVVYPRLKNGQLGEPTATIQHTGSGPNPDRQEAPHPHAIVPSLDNQFLLVPDLGLDLIKVYAFNDETGTLDPQPTLDTPVPPGSGPRHLVFHPSGNYAYASLEMSSQVAAFRYANGKLELINTYRTLPDTFQGESTTAELRITQDGRFLYVANRGHDSLAAFTIDPNSGEPTRIQTISTQGRTPRNFGIDPSDRFIVAGNQDSHTMLSYRIDEQTGKLTPTGKQIATPSPVLFHFTN